MKKILTLLTAFVLAFTLVGCSSSKDKKGIDAEKLDKNNPVTLKIGASNVPHAEILEHIAPKLLEEGIKLDIVTYQDYYLPNKTLSDKEIDANYFQHIPFLNVETKEKGYDLENAGAIHLEPLGLYSTKVKNLNDLRDGGLVLISNNKAEWGRVIKLLVDANLVKVKDGVDIINATFDDIVENKKNLVFKYDNDPSIMVQYYKNGEGDLVSINSNFAVDAGISPKDDAVVIEKGENNPYANIIAVRKGDKDKLVIKKLIEALKSDDTKNFIDSKYKGSVVLV